MTLAELARGGDDPGQAILPYAGSWASTPDARYPYHDVWDYAGFGAPNMQGVQGGDQPAQYRFMPGPGHEENGQWVPEDKYRSIVSYLTDAGGGDDPRSSTRTSIDWSRLPALSLPQGWERFNTQAGGGLMPVKGQSLRNPGLIYNDPNYGPMTPFGNRRVETSERLSQLGQLAIMALAGGAFGGVVGPSINSSLNLAGNTLLSGRLDPVRAASTAAGLSGVDPELITLAKLAYGLRP